MKNGDPQFRELETLGHMLDDTLRRADPGAYVSMAAYAPSSSDPGSVFALFHTSEGPADARRADQYIYRRRLDASQSIAAAAAATGGIVTGDSYMFPDEHSCINLPLGNGPQKGVLQIVYNKAGRGVPHPGALASAASATHRNGQLLDTAYDDLIRGVADLDGEFNVRAAYAPNGIIVACDISGFSDISAQIGQYRAQDFVDGFCTEFVTGIADKYGADILRFEGDGAWLIFPIDATHSAEQARKSAFLAMKEMSDRFAPFAHSNEPGFGAAKIKIAAELGDAIVKESIPATKLGTGPVFTYVANALETADRQHNAILIGPELAKLSNMPAAPLSFTPLKRGGRTP